jgi:hypothetical protein
VKPYVEGYLDFKNLMGLEVTEIEKVVYSEEWDYAGTLDRVADSRGRFPEGMVIDLKSGSKSKGHILQVAAYALAYGAEIKHGGTLYLKANGKYSFDYYDYEVMGKAIEDWQLIMHKYRAMEADLWA